MPKYLIQGYDVNDLQMYIEEKPLVFEIEFNDDIEIFKQSFNSAIFNEGEAIISRHELLEASNAERIEVKTFVAAMLTCSESEKIQIAINKIN